MVSQSIITFRRNSECLLVESESCVGLAEPIRSIESCLELVTFEVEFRNIEFVFAQEPSHALNAIACLLSFVTLWMERYHLAVELKCIAGTLKIFSSGGGRKMLSLGIRSA